jgi:hypothetical protein
MKNFDIKSADEHKNITVERYLKIMKDYTFIYQ